MYLPEGRTPPSSPLRYTGNPTDGWGNQSIFLENLQDSSLILHFALIFFGRKDKIREPDLYRKIKIWG